MENLILMKSSLNTDFFGSTEEQHQESADIGASQFFLCGTVTSLHCVHFVLSCDPSVGSNDVIK